MTRETKIGLLVGLGSRDAVAISERELLIDAVQQGSLDITVEGFGELVSARQQLITTPSAATVKEIVLKPGAKVSVDSVIVPEPEVAVA